MAASLAVLAAPALLAIDSGVSSATNATVVERYEAESTVFFASSSEDGRASGEVVADRLRFEPGDRTFEGSPVDLAGREGEVDSLSGLFEVEPSVSGSVLNGQATVTSRDGEAASAKFFGDGEGFTLEELSSGDTFVGSGRFTSFDPDAVPELDGAELYFHSTYTVNGVDAVNAVATVACEGELEAAASHAAQESLAARVSTWRTGGTPAVAGAGLLALGLVGFGATNRQRRE